ncbi:M1 family metallopeptidase [Pseudomonadota bacterium]|uniref:M1 family metallopeptidase n=1 Tax=unclassified Shewanella TaxID=196818 RepID=UPI0018E4683F|nr:MULTISPECIES: M1 family metallopeptidase [unclassified Shewanella]MDO6641178.1 M1 family metallopeptidase [Shewanella sp. 5_MG-2023]
MRKLWDNNRDYHSVANTDQIKVHHLQLNLDVDFDKQQLVAQATLQFNRCEDCNELVLDGRDLIIDTITDNSGRLLEFSIEHINERQGEKIIIAVGDDINQVTISYRTSPKAQGLQWLTPEQTLGKQVPYLFSQSQPVNARSWIPLQDTPKARITFSAAVKVNNGLRAVMSAANSDIMPADGVFQFEMEKPIPTHLLALAVGDLAYGAISDRCGIYTEPAMLAKALAEFEDTEEMILAAESLLGPYPWDRYDMIVLPPSFPFGGMENPRLAFITPTLIAGDKSLVSTVAHELAHSWTGNLVSNATWRDLWLNEGFTTYFTNRLVEKIYGKEQAELEWVIEFGRLKEEMISMPLAAQTLPANVQQQDANDAFNRFTYDKASMFVHELEARLGRNDFDQFLFDYVQHFKFQAITTETFIEYAKQTLLVQYPEAISESELMTWVYGEGLPQWFVGPTSTSLDKVDLALQQLKLGDSAAKLNVAGWRVHHWQYFIKQLPLQLTQLQLTDLDSVFGFSGSQNAELACDWYSVAIRNNYEIVLPKVAAFLGHIGRAKFVKPLYNELLIAGYEQQALAIFQQARAGYHPSLQVQLDALMQQL